MPKKEQTSKTLPTFDEVRSLIKRADVAKPQQADVDALKELIRETPEKSIWRDAGDLLTQARAQCLQKSGATGFGKEVIGFRCEQMEKELASEGDGPLEKLLIGQIVFAWLRLSFIEYAYSEVWDSADGVSFERGLFWEKRLTAAQKRFHSACVSLARVRKLMRPSKAKNTLSVGTINALLSDKYADDTLGAVLKRQAQIEK